jgi:hypothetical protein
MIQDEQSIDIIQLLKDLIGSSIFFHTRKELLKNKYCGPSYHLQTIIRICLVEYKFNILSLILEKIKKILSSKDIPKQLNFIYTDIIEQKYFI